MQECRSFDQSYILLMLCYCWCNRRSLQVLLKLADCTRKSKFETDRFEKSEMNLTNTLLMFGEMPQTPVNLTPCKWLGALKQAPLKHNIIIWKACSCIEKYFRFKYPLASSFKHFSGVISHFLILQNFEDFHNSSLVLLCGFIILVSWNKHLKVRLSTFDPFKWSCPQLSKTFLWARVPEGGVGAAGLLLPLCCNQPMRESARAGSAV